jgi:hypothetical protein
VRSIDVNPAGPPQPRRTRTTEPGQLYERDPEAWNAYLAEGNANQARKRVSADVILRDSGGRILLVDPTYKPDWDLPGGMAEANEPPAEALRRELREELGLDLRSAACCASTGSRPMARGMTCSTSSSTVALSTMRP